MLFPPNLFVIFIIDLLKNLIYFIHFIYFLTKKLPTTIHKLYFFDLIIVFFRFLLLNYYNAIELFGGKWTIFKVFSEIA